MGQNLKSAKIIQMKITGFTVEFNFTLLMTVPSRLELLIYVEYFDIEEYYR